MLDKTFKKHLILITYALILAFLLMNISAIMKVLGSILGVLTPLWLGIALAYLLNIPMVYLEEKVFMSKEKGIRILSLILSILIIVILILALFVFVIPDLIKSASFLVKEIPTLFDSLNNILIKTLSNTDLSAYLKNFTGNSEVSNFISNLFKGLINNFTELLANFVSLIVNLVTGIIIAVYFLLEKEPILKIVKSIKDIFIKGKLKRRVDNVLIVANKHFNNFITYQCLECFILGLLMFLAFTIFRFPYALTIAFLTGITAMIPIFGATFACIIGAILIGTTSIKTAFVFVIVFQVIQQIENNFIYPRVVGKNVGLPPVITILALIIGEKLAGLLGMILCIPVTAVIHSLFMETINKNVLE